MNQLLEVRRNFRRKINSHEKLDRSLHIFVTLMLTTNVVLILYAMFSISLRMTFGGVGLVDTLPIALYILPLMIFLPLMIRAYYRDRTAAWNFVFLIITSVVFGMLSSLIRGFLICLFFNIIAVVSIFLLGRFRPKGSLRKVGKKTIAYVILLNILGLTFPVSIVLMGQTPIANIPPIVVPQITFTVPLSDFDFAIYLDFKVLEDNSSSWANLRTWLVAINDTEIAYTVTLVANRGLLAGESPETLATARLIEDIYLSHANALYNLVEVSLVNITNTPDVVLFDMTLSTQEWQALMNQTRSLNLVGFSSLMRFSFNSTPPDSILSGSTSLHLYAESTGLNTGLVVESFVVDDLQDGDTGAMVLCGLTDYSITLWDRILVSCERSRFSYEMAGDVGEYLVHSFSGSIGVLGNHWGLRLGEVGSSIDILGRENTVYVSMDVLVNDIVLAMGNRVRMITISSLPSLLSTFGDDALEQLWTAIGEADYGVATYTFRIYAYRAVFMAIDAFDFIML
jgi:hypothetical protein